MVDAAVVVGAEVVIGAAVDGGADVDDVVAALSSSPSLQAASVAAIVLARNTRRVSRGAFSSIFDLRIAGTSSKVSATV
ncbi:MAG TPA: hypothetical protein VHN36_03645 [Ilumatobacteraceae bacterium]|nr:hypothetical protein [Ilumatobacteraceae bacterium]